MIPYGGFAREFLAIVNPELREKRPERSNSRLQDFTFLPTWRRFGSIGRGCAGRLGSSTRFRIIPRSGGESRRQTTGWTTLLRRLVPSCLPLSPLLPRNKRSRILGYRNRGYTRQYVHVRVTLFYFSVLHLAEDVENARINGMYKKKKKIYQTNADGTNAILKKLSVSRL